MSITPPSEEGRGIAGIAHLFLSQSNNGNDSRPARLSPEQLRDECLADNSNSSQSSSNSSDDNSNSQNNESGDGSSENQRPPARQENTELTGQAPGYSPLDKSRTTGHNRRLSGIALLADHLDNYAEITSNFARQWADKNERAGVLNLETFNAELIEFVKQPSSDERATKTAWDELFGQADTESTGQLTAENAAEALTGALTDIAMRCDTLLVNIGKGKRQEVLELLELCRHVVIVTSCSSDDIVETYKTIKWLGPLAWKDMDISLFVCGAQDEATARKIHEKLNSTAWEFLGIDVKWAGWEHNEAKINERRIGIFEGGEELLEELAEFLVQTGRVKDETPPQVPESLGGQRDASLTNQENVSMKAKVKTESESSEVTEELTSPLPENQEEQAATAIPTENPAVPPPAAKPLPLAPIVVGQLPRSDQELADALQLALPGWLNQLPTVMSLPVDLPADIDPAVRIFVDANGRLHVFLASLDGGEILPRVLKARQWLTDNLALIISHCRQIKINRSLPIGIVLVTSGSIDALRQSCEQISDFPSQVLQLHLLQNDTGSSLLVI